MTARPHSLIRLEGVEKTFPLGKTIVKALRGADLAIEREEFVVLVGPSGSGKSTLLNIIGCLDTPTAGHYWLDGKAIAAADVDDLATIRNARIGFVFQSFNLIPVLDVYENIELPLLLSPDPPKPERREQILALAERVGLTDHLHHRPDELSGGQRQRVAIARALVTQPDIVLADEPTANLDSETAAQILDLLAELNQRYGTTILVCTHDPRVLERATRILHIADGVILPDDAHAAALLSIQPASAVAPAVTADTPVA